MSKQREEVIALVAAKIAAAMQPEIDRLKNNQCSGHFRIGCSYMSGCNTICNKCGHVHNADTGLAYIQQLSAANQRNKELQSENETCRNLMRIKQEQNDAFSQRIQELLDLVEVVERRNKQLEATLNQVRSTYNQIIAEDTAIRNEYLDEIAKLEDRIRVADAEEPVARVTHTLLGFNVSYLKTLRGVTTLYAHAQIPAEVELKAKIAELEAIIKASQEQEQEPVAYVDSEQLRRWDVLRGTDYESPERCYMPWSRDRFKTDLTNCDFPVYAALVIKEQYKVVFYINPDDLVVDKADKKYVTDIPCDGCTEALFIKEQLCAHGRALNDYCELCGRIHSA